MVLRLYETSVSSLSYSRFRLRNGQSPCADYPPLITDSLTFIDPVEIRFSPLEREISGTVIPHLQSISYGPDKFCLRVSAFRLPGALKFSIAFCIQLYKLDYPFTLPYNTPFGYCHIGGYLCIFCNDITRYFVGPSVFSIDPFWYYPVYLEVGLISWLFLLHDDSLIPIGVW